MRGASNKSSWRLTGQDFSSVYGNVYERYQLMTHIEARTRNDGGEVCFYGYLFWLLLENLNYSVCTYITTYQANVSNCKLL